MREQMLRCRNYQVDLFPIQKQFLVLVTSHFGLFYAKFLYRARVQRPKAHLKKEEELGRSFSKHG